MEIKNLLVTTDFSDESKRAFPAAASIARKFKAAIHLAHVFESWQPIPHFHAEGVGLALPEADYRRDVEKRLRKLASEHAAFAGLAVEPRVLSDGSAAEALRRFEAERAIDLTVLSTHGRTGLGHYLLGGFAQRTVRTLSSPVLTYRSQAAGGEAFEPKEVLVPFDFSDNAGAVLPALRFLAGRYGSRVTFLHIIEPMLPVYDEPAVPAYYELIQQAVQDAPRKARDRFEALRQKELPGIETRIETGEGRPPVEICRKAEELRADLIVLATHGWTGLRHLLLGSVAEKVVWKAPCSVLTIRSTGPAA